jgi:hypothetical protein
VEFHSSWWVEQYETCKKRVAIVSTVSDGLPNCYVSEESSLALSDQVKTSGVEYSPARTKTKQITIIHPCYLRDHH